MKRGEASNEEIIQYKKAKFITQFVVGSNEKNLEQWWDKFYTTESEGRFWNIVKEKRWIIDDVTRSDANCHTPNEPHNPSTYGWVIT